MTAVTAQKVAQHALQMISTIVPLVNLAIGSQRVSVILKNVPSFTFSKLSIVKLSVANVIPLVNHVMDLHTLNVHLVFLKIFFTQVSAIHVQLENT